MRIEVRLEGKTVVDVNFDLRYLIGLAQDAEKDIQRRGAWGSSPIDIYQARAVIRQLDEKAIELLKWIVLGGGNITWPKVQQICGIEGRDFGDFERRYLQAIHDAVRAATDGKYSFLLWFTDGAPEWDTPDWRDAKLEIDGPALTSLRAVLIDYDQIEDE
jgi:hypothetical protein